MLQSKRQQTLHPVPDDVSVLIAARRPGTRSALWSLLEREPSLTPVASASEIASLVRMLRDHEPDVVVVDGGVLGEGGLRRLPTLAHAAPRTAFIVVGMGDHPGFAARAAASGAAGYVRLDEAAERLPAVALRAAAGR